MIVKILEFLLFFYLISTVGGYSLIASVGGSILGVLVIKAVLGRKILRESIETNLISTANLWSVFGQELNPEPDRLNTKATPTVEVEGDKYFGLFFHRNTIPKEVDHVEYVTVIDKSTNKVVEEDSEDLGKILDTIFLWLHLYGNPPLPESDEKHLHSKLLLKQQKKRIKKMKEMAEDQDKFDRIDTERMKEIIRELDDQLKEQSEIQLDIIDIKLELTDSIWHKLSYPSFEGYKEIIEQLESCSKMSEKENQIWQNRKNTWEELTAELNKKLEKMPESDYSGFHRSIFLDIVFAVILEGKMKLASILPTLTEIGLESKKDAKRRAYDFWYNYITYSKMGIEAIEHNIESNKEYGKKYRELNEVWKKDWKKLYVEKGE